MRRASAESVVPGLDLGSELASVLYVDGVLTGDGKCVRVDMHGSVSALVEAEAVCVHDGKILARYGEFLKALEV